jgi:hypothetical protein
MDLRRLGQLAAHREHGVERGHRLLEDHADLAAAHPPHLVFGELEKVATLEENLAVQDAAGGRRHEAHDAERTHRLAAARLPHEGNRLPRLDVPRHSVDRAHHAARSRELRLEVFDIEEEVSTLLHCPGSLAHARHQPVAEGKTSTRGGRSQIRSSLLDPLRLQPGGWRRGCGCVAGFVPPLASVRSPQGGDSRRLGWRSRLRSRTPGDRTRPPRVRVSPRPLEEGEWRASGRRGRSGSRPSRRGSA